MVFEPRALFFLGVVFVVVLVGFILFRRQLLRGRRWQPEVMKNIEALREARRSGWDGVSDDLDTLLSVQFEERMSRRRSFWARVVAREKAEER